MIVEVALYCPHCGDRVQREPLSIDMQEVIHCTACFQSFSGSDLLTDKGRTFLDHLVLLLEQTNGSVPDDR